MSSLFLPIALIATFGAVALLAYAVRLSLAERRRPVELLEAQVGQALPDLRERQLNQSFVSRVALPVINGFGRTVRRITPIDARQRIARKLVLAGSPAGWDAERVAAFKIVGGVAGLGLGLVAAGRLGQTGIRFLLVTALFPLVGFFGPDGIIGSKIRARQSAIRKALPDTMDLLTISVEAGLGFDAALRQVVLKVPGELSQEISRMLQELQLGVSRVDALRHLADRTDVEELQAFVLAMVQADVFGVSISKVLRAQAKDLRTKRRQSAERQAMQVPVKILFPMIFCILPALFVVVVGPGVIRIMTDLLGLTP